MEGILDWGVEVVVWLQRASPSLDVPFIAITFLGHEAFFLVLLPLVYWSVDRRTGARLAVLLLLSECVNAAAKSLAAQPRPFEYDARVRKLIDAGGGGFPSGHTQGAVVVWGYLAWCVRRPWLWGLAGALMVLIPLSRVYLGVHFPTDLVGGYVLGAALLVLYLRLEGGAERWLVRVGLGLQLVAAVAVPALLALALWGAGAHGASAAGALMGLGVGVVLERRWVGFEARGDAWKQALRVGLGVPVLLALRVGLAAGAAGLEPAAVFRFVQYAVLGLAVALAGPWAFVRCRLAETHRHGAARSE